MKNYYVWAGGQIHEYDTWAEVRRYKRCHLYKPTAWETKWRMVRKHQWSGITKDRMPKDFLLALLLMGVPT